MPTFKKHDTSTAWPKASLRASSALWVGVSNPGRVKGPRVGVVGVEEDEISNPGYKPLF